MNTVHQKVSGNSTGKNAPFKKDGYAGSGPVPPSMIGTKEGVTPGKPYSGPNVARGKHST